MACAHLLYMKYVCFLKCLKLKTWPFTDEAQLTSYKKESKDNKEGTESSVYVINLTCDIKRYS